MSRIQQLFYLLLVAFGAIGVTGCLVSLVVVWMVQTRVEHATQKVFRRADETLVLVEQRLTLVEQRVASAKITGQEIQQSVEEWVESKVDVDIEVPPRLRDRADHLATSMEKAEGLLEISEAALEIAEQVFALRHETSETTRSSQRLNLREELQAVRQEVEQARIITEQFASGEAELSDKIKSELAEIKPVQFLLRVVATLANVEQRFAQLQAQVASFRSELVKFESQIRADIFWSAIAGSFGLAWMAAGQVAMVVVGWGRLRK